MHRACSMSILLTDIEHGLDLFYYQTMLATPYIISEMAQNHVRYLKLISNMVWIHLWYFFGSMGILFSYTMPRAVLAFCFTSFS